MEKSEQVISPEELMTLCAKVADDRKAENVVSLEVSETSGIADYFVLCTGNSEPHIKAIADRIGREVKTQYGIRPRTVEGTAASQWMLLDYGIVVIHIMSPDMRDQYQLESLWGDSPKQEAVDILSQGPEK